MPTRLRTDARFRVGAYIRQGSRVFRVCAYEARMGGFELWGEDIRWPYDEVRFTRDDLGSLVLVKRAPERAA